MQLPHVAWPGIAAFDYEFAIVQLVQTTLRSEVGKIDLDKTFEERERVNNAVVMSIDAATQPWGVKQSSGPA